MDRATAAGLDAEDPLARFRDEFAPAGDVIYFDGNSLGRLPRRTAARLSAVVEEEWGRGLVRSWGAWVDLPQQVGDRIGRVALGAAPGQVIVADSTTINLYKLVAAALDARPGRPVVVHDPGDFPTDRYVLAGLARARGLALRGAIPAEAKTVIGRDVALVMFSAVDYRSGEVADTAAVTAAAHDAGALVLWDLSHAAGALEVRLDEWGADLAVGCTYKYLNGGPGAPAWLYVRRPLQEELLPPVWGWFGQDGQFAMGPRFSPAPGMPHWLSGTPPVLGLAAVDEGASLLEDAGIARVRAKGMALTRFAIEVADARLSPLGFGVGPPRDPARLGSHVALHHDEAYRLSRALREEASTVPDFRPPDVLRIGLSPLSTSFVDVWDGLEHLRRLAAERAWERYDPEPGRVT